LVAPEAEGDSPPGPAELARNPAAIPRAFPGGAQTRSSALPASPLPPPAEYLAQISKIKNLIAAGDCYQVNLSQKFAVPVHQPPALIYQHLRAVSPSPYAAYLNLGDAQILSSSPELFLELDGRRVITRPIKGTRPRGADSLEDAKLKEELSLSVKDRAELLMITDLERNDLGRVCRPGSVRVSALRTVESYPQVHHLVSTIEGDLGENRDVVDVLKATFPGGSITGAPKIRAMQVIRELEPHAREIYCGAIGYVSLNGKAQFNVAIRTMAVKDGQAHFWSGGGIVADSDPQAEYEETLVKARGMIRALS
jgi:para-aminobenzoate synthetase component 1